MRILKNADKKVKTVLGRQHIRQPEPDGQAPVKLSGLVYRSQKQHVLFHELTREMIWLDDQEWKCVTKVLTEGSDLSGDLEKTLFEKFYLVPATQEEDRFYLQFMDILNLTFPPVKGVFHYTILPTTACNARCVYCYEASYPTQTMTPETEERLIRYICETHNTEKTIFLNWFGGEPLAGAGTIRRVCRALADEGIDFQSLMISNGSLFTPELVQEATKHWKLQRIQISMDGDKKTYLERKRYLNTGSHSEADPYERVIQNVRLLIDAGVRVILRCNCDWENLPTLETFLQDLVTRFSPWPKELFIYFSPLNSKKSAENFPQLFEKLMQMAERCAGFGIQALGQEVSSSLRIHHCMSDCIRNYRLIDPSGRLFDCEHMPEDRCYGNIWEGITDQKLADSLSDRSRIRERCRHCVFLPECTAYPDCPVESWACRENHTFLIEKYIAAKLAGKETVKEEIQC